MKCMRILATLLVTLACALPATAQSSDETAKRRHHLPHIADGDGWRSLVLVTNVSPSASRCTLESHGLSLDRFEAMSDVSRRGPTATFELPGNGGFLVWPTRNELALASGYATLDCSSPVVAQVVFASVGRSGAPTGMATVLSSQTGTVFQIPVLTQAGSLGLAFENDTNDNALCHVVLETPQRVNQGEATLSVPSKSNMSAMLRDVISVPQGFPGGTATVTCNQRVALIGLHFELQPNGSIITFTTLPPAILATFRQRVTSPERVALEAFYDATGGPRWSRRTNWKTSAPLGQWHGVRTDASGRVIELKLDNNGLSGTIPAALGNLNHLQHLDLSRNKLGGPIPAALGNLNHLQQLILSHNALTGELPMSLTNLRQLGMLWFNDNEGLCMPSTSAFREWRGGIASVEGPTCGTTAMPGTDRAALEALYDATGGPSWKSSTNWKTSAPLDAWEGVSTDDAGRVAALLLSRNNLSGPIPAELGNLTRLRGMILSANNLRGPIPRELGNLTNLIWLDLSENDLSGPIPAELGKLTRLKELELQFNQLSGQIPPGLGNLTSLEELGLSDNNLSGPVPGELGRLTNLIWLDLSDNALTGELPSSLTSLQQMHHFSFLDNAGLCAPVTPAFTEWLRGIPEATGPTCGSSTTPETDRGALEAIYDATGGPSWYISTNWKTSAPLGQWHGVETDAEGRVIRLELSRNNLTGLIPPGLGNLTHLEWLDLSENNLGGTIPAELGNLYNLQQVDLRMNNLTGLIQPALGNLSSLNWLLLSENQLTGELPSSLTRLQNLTWFLFGANSGLCVPSTPAFTEWLAGIPSALGLSCGPPTTPDTDRYALEAFYDATGGPAWSHRRNWKTSTPLRNWEGVETDADGWVTTLDLSRNHLSGSIPSALGHLTRLERLDLSRNSLSGPIPPLLGHLTRLERLELTGNNLSGPIPVELGNLTGLERLDLSENNLSGPIPVELGSLTGLERLDLDENDLSGSIPVELGNLTRLESLDLSHNNLIGPIPVELGRLTRLESLDLSRNDLSGLIPVELGRLTRLESLDLSENFLGGTIPEEMGNLTSLDELDLSHNDFYGQLPSSLTNLQLRGFEWNDNAGLCAPSTPAFRDWLREIEDVDGPMCGPHGVPNHPPEPDGTILGVELQVGDPPLDVAVGPYFLDPDGDDLVYSVSQTPEGRVRVAIEGFSTLVIEAAVAGTDTVTVTARDPGGLTAQQTMDVTVTPPDTSAETDRAGLEALFDATGGSNWLRSTNWKTSAPLEDWYGVRTDAAGRVTYLALRQNNLSGPIPTELGLLTHLRGLDLNNNELSGPIPEEFGNLTRLLWLRLRQNYLQGQIPAALGNLTRLLELHLLKNALRGPVPASLGNLTRLEDLLLSENYLTGELPSSLTNLQRLERLWFNDNAGLCVPSTAAFRNWLRGIASVAGPKCGSSASSAMPGTDRQALEAFYAAAGGLHGIGSTNRKASARLEEWYGVRTDGDGGPLPFREEKKHSLKAP